MNEPKTVSHKIIDPIRRDIIAGILVWVPVVITFLVLKYLFNSVDGILAPFLRRFFGLQIPGLGIVAGLVLLYLTGLFTSHYFGRQLVKWGDSILERVPIVKNIYLATKQFLHTITTSGKMQFKRVVLVKYPNPGFRAVGFVTGSSKNPEGRTLLHVFIPTTPNPTSGMLELIPEEEVLDTSMSIEEGLRLVVSGGILAPSDLHRPPDHASS